MAKLSIMNTMIIIDPKSKHSALLRKAFKDTFKITSYKQINGYENFILKPEDVIVFHVSDFDSLFDFFVLLFKKQFNCRLFAISSVKSLEKKLYKLDVFLVLPYYYSKEQIVNAIKYVIEN